ncbi:MAG: 7-cyano-7-deazaguanine synthase QueC [Acidimicrobiales bacterium]
MSGAPAIVLLSGGLDSATCLAIACESGYDVVALSFRYGQRHLVELTAAAALAERAGVEHVVVDVDLSAFGGSALTTEVPVPKHDAVADLDADIPVTYVPARNTVFLSLALALAEVRGADDLFIGVNAVDYSGYPDCRPEFIAAFERLANVATRAAVADGRRLRVHTPLIALTKADIIRRGVELGVDYAATITCYDPGTDGSACGHCDACLLRRQGFVDAGVPDPTRYRGGSS